MFFELEDELSTAKAMVEELEIRVAKERTTVAQFRQFYETLRNNFPQIAEKYTAYDFDDSRADFDKSKEEVKK